MSGRQIGNRLLIHASIFNYIKYPLCHVPYFGIFIKACFFDNRQIFWLIMIQHGIQRICFVPPFFPFWNVPEFWLYHRSQPGVIGKNKFCIDKMTAPFFKFRKFLCILPCVLVVRAGILAGVAAVYPFSEFAPQWLCSQIPTIPCCQTGNTGVSAHCIRRFQ